MIRYEIKHRDKQGRCCGLYPCEGTRWDNGRVITGWRCPGPWSACNILFIGGTLIWIRQECLRPLTLKGLLQ